MGCVRCSGLCALQWVVCVAVGCARCSELCALQWVVCVAVSCARCSGLCALQRDAVGHDAVYYTLLQCFPMYYNVLQWVVIRSLTPPQGAKVLLLAIWAPAGYLAAGAQSPAGLKGLALTRLFTVKRLLLAIWALNGHLVVGAPGGRISQQEGVLHLLGVAVCCSVLQCVAVCCSVLQCVAVCCSVLVYCICHSSTATHFFDSTHLFHCNYTATHVSQGISRQELEGVVRNNTH